MTRVLRLLPALLAALGLASVARAQGSPYLPLDDVGYGWVDALQQRGHLRPLSLLERPYAIEAIRRVLAASDTATWSPVLRGWARSLDRAMTKYEPAARAAGDTTRGVALAASGAFFGTAQSSGLRELMLADDVSGGYPGATLRLGGASGPVVASVRIVADSRLPDDPQYFGKEDRWIVGRAEEAYVAARWPLAEIMLGRVARSWGPTGLDGLHLGRAAFTYDQLWARLGNDRIRLSGLVARLNDMPGTESLGGKPVTAQRWLSLHRLAGRLGPVELGLAESVVWSGVGRGVETPYVNPLNFFMLAQWNENILGNVSWSADAALRTRAGIASAQFFLDDVQVDDVVEPPGYGTTLAVDGIPLFGDHRWSASYTRLSNYTYRTADPTEAYTHLYVGLGRAFADYDESRVSLDLAVLPWGTLRPYAAFRRQGEGSYTRPYPTNAQFSTVPGFLEGVRRYSSRLGVSVGARLRHLELSADLGVNRERNVQHRPGVHRNAAEGRVRIAVEPSWATLRGIAR